jgi:hypothetical protein
MEEGTNPLPIDDESNIEEIETRLAKIKSGFKPHKRK